MTSFLGYDPAKLRRLRDLLGALEHERLCTGSVDPAVAVALQGYRLATGRLLAHTVRLDLILGCGVGADYRPVAPAAALADHLTISRAGTWPVVTDPVAAAAALPPGAKAAAVALALEADGADAIEHWAGLATALGDVASDPVAAAALLRRLEAAGLDDLVHDLADELRTPEGRVARARRVLAGLGQVLGATPGGGARIRDIAPLDALGAALLLAGATTRGVAGTDLATTATAILTRLADRPSATTVSGEQQAAHDAVLSALARDAGAARAVLTMLDDDVLEHVLTTPWRDAGRLGQVLLVATDPRATTAAEAALVVPRVLRRLEAARGRLSDQAPPAAAPVAPDPLDPMVSFTGEPAAEVPRGIGRIAGWWAEGLIDRGEGGAGGAPVGYPVAPWEMGGREAVRLLDWVASFPGERDGMVAAATATYVDRLGTLTDPGLVGHAAYVTSAVLDVVHHEHLDRTAHDVAQREAVLGLLQDLAGLTKIGGAVTGGATIVEVVTGTDPLLDMLLPGARGPESVRDVAARLVAGGEAHVVTLQSLAATAVTARYTSAHPSTRVAPPPAPPAGPPAGGSGEIDPGDKADGASAAWEASYARWLDALPPGLRVEVDATVQHVGSAARAARAYVA